jgi:uncharacterized surface protein with fasciclin (FAS1) repeats
MRSNIVLKTAIVIFLGGLLNSSCSSSLGSYTTPNNILGKLRNVPELSSFASLLEKVPSVGKVLGGKSPVTLLAPTNDAIAGLGQEALSHLTSSKEGLKELEAIVKKHIVPGTVNPEELMAGNIQSVTRDRVEMGDAKIVGTPVLADNGVIQMIDKVLK